MSNRYTLRLDPGPEEKLHDSCGNRIDEDYVEQAVSDVDHALGSHPSLSGKRNRSPQVTCRCRN